MIWQDRYEAEMSDLLKHKIWVVSSLLRMYYLKVVDMIIWIGPFTPAHDKNKPDIVAG